VVTHYRPTGSERKRAHDGCISPVAGVLSRLFWVFLGKLEGVVLPPVSLVLDMVSPPVLLMGMAALAVIAEHLADRRGAACLGPPVAAGRRVGCPLAAPAELHHLRICR
jgi:hypothetical protein